MRLTGAIQRHSFVGSLSCGGAAMVQKSSDLGAPKADEKQNQQVLLKLGQRVAAGIAKYKIHDRPINVKCTEIGAAKTNRNKSVPNMQYVHQTLYKNIIEDSFDPERLLPGICVLFKDPVKVKENLDWNLSFSSGSSLFPPVRVAEMNKGSLACTHTNVAFRCIEAGMVSQLTHQKFTAEGDLKLEEVVRVGHFWWVLSEDCPEDLQRLSGMVVQSKMKPTGCEL